jgi:hypothetical protein
VRVAVLEGGEAEQQRLSDLGLQHVGARLEIVQHSGPTGLLVVRVEPTFPSMTIARRVQDNGRASSASSRAASTIASASWPWGSMPLPDKKVQRR